MPSRFCHELKATVLPSFHDISTSSADWMEVIATLELSTTGICVGKRTPDDYSPLAKPVSNSSDMFHAEDCQSKSDSPPSNVRFRACQHFINLLCWMPKGNISSRSFSLYTTNVLELERYTLLLYLPCTLSSYQWCLTGNIFSNLVHCI